MSDTIQHTITVIDTIAPQTTVRDSNRAIINNTAQSATNNQNNAQAISNNPVTPINESADNKETVNSEIPKVHSLYHYFDDPFYSVSDSTNLADTTVVANKTVFFNGSPADVYGNSSEKSTVPYTQKSTGTGFITTNPLKTSWLDAISVGLIIFFILVLAFTRRFILSIFPLLFSYQKAHKQFEEDSQSSSFSRRLYFIPGILTFSVYTFFIIHHFHFISGELFTPQTLLYITAVLAAASVIKQLLLWIISAVTLSRNFISELSFNRQLSLIACTVALFPVTALLPLYHSYNTQNILLYIGTAIIAATFISIFIRSLILFQTYRVSLFLWILYLCILEIGPYLALLVLFQ